MAPDGARDPRSRRSNAAGRRWWRYAGGSPPPPKPPGRSVAIPGPASDAPATRAGRATTHHAGDATRRGPPDARPAAAERRGGAGRPDRATRPRAEGGLDEDAINPQTLAAALAGLGAGGAKATLMLTMSLTDLQHRVGAATTLGSLDHGSLLGPGDRPADRLRRAGHPDAARQRRRGARPRPGRAAVQPQPRPEWCCCGIDIAASRPVTFPGSGASCITSGTGSTAGQRICGNAALLCARHHTIVHRDRLTATVTSTGVQVGHHPRQLRPRPRPRPTSRRMTNGLVPAPARRCAGPPPR